MPDMQEINHHVITEFRTNGGRLSGPMEGAPILLLTTTGRHTGNPHTTPVGFIDANGTLAIAAANGGSDNHPDWYKNLLAQPSVTIEVPGATISAHARVTTGPERDALLSQLLSSLPGMSDHVASAERDVPVLVLTED